MIRIIADAHIPFLKGALEPYANIAYLPGANIKKDDIKNTDALITRTRTKCNKELLDDTNVKLITTATIGFDHIDTNYLREQGIEWTNAPGCNSGSVNQYIASSLFTIRKEHNISLEGKTIGIIGYGHVGKKVAKDAKTFGLKVLINDPPLERETNSPEFVSLETIMQNSDIISLHVPLIKTGKDKTLHMVNEDFLENLPKKPFIINSSRGPVVATNALYNAIKNGKISGAVIDVWEDEPNIPTDLLHSVTIATPHIAGYSVDGKAEGTKKAVQTISRFFNLGIDNWKAENLPLPTSQVIKIQCNQKSTEEVISEAILTTYDIRSDHKALVNNPSTFENLRNNYPIRREYHAYTIALENDKKNVASKLKELGFKVAP